MVIDSMRPRPLLVHPRDRRCATDKGPLMKLLTTCTVCSELLHATTYTDTVHPTCDTRPPDVPRHRPVPEAPYLDHLVADFHDAVASGDTAEADRLERLVDSIDHAPPRLPDAAALYASWGWPVFPLRPGGKAPLTRHGFKDASTDPAQVAAWWKDNPTANIGLPTGGRFDVVDVDTPIGMTRSWAGLRDSAAMPDVHGVVTTASGGLHAYITPTGGGNLAGLRPGIDYRGVGGYVVAPPSIREDGRRWVWTARPSPVIVVDAARSVAA